MMEVQLLFAVRLELAKVILAKLIAEILAHRYSNCNWVSHGIKQKSSYNPESESSYFTLNCVIRLIEHSNQHNMISQLKVKTTIPKYLLEHCIGAVHVSQQTLWGYSFIIFVSFTAGRGCILSVKIWTFNVKIINKVNIPFYKAKDTFGVNEYKGKEFFI